MGKGKPLLRWAGIICACAVISFMTLEAQGEKEPLKPAAPGRPDLIKIDVMAAPGKLEMPAVTFLHDKHTEALLKEKKSCDACHVVEGNRLNLAFKRKTGTKPEELKAIYHANCIGCHQEGVAAGKKSGPLDGFCRDCHNAKPAATVARLDAGLDKVLHYRHVDSKDIPAGAGEKDNCGACHHEYDRKAKKTFYAKGKESSCRTCHVDKPQDDTKSLEVAAHLQCVECHRTLANKGVKEPVPMTCEGCHGAKGQAKIAKKNQEVVAALKGKELPRLMRGQPDAALIGFDPKIEGAKQAKTPAMSPVAFDHKAHEQYSDSCRVCHHASLDSCQKCHTLAGAKDGKFVTFEQAMHSKSSKHSCIGCHTAKQAAPECAGCHATMASRKPEEASCKQCHLPPPTGGAPVNLADLSPAQKSAMAEGMLKGRRLASATYPVHDIPDKVTIKELSDKYEAVDLTHRKHMEALMKGMKDSRLAAYFHREEGTVCQGCHHNSPAGKNPPGCVSCHAKVVGQAGFDPRAENRPGLLAAQHGQCMSCHKEMAVKPVSTACTECHLEKKKK